MKSVFFPVTRWRCEGLAMVRIITGLFMAFHGWEVFDPGKMNAYLEWDQFKHASASLMVYSGKTAELAGGLFFMLGLFTRLAAVVIIGTMCYISFFVGGGKIWYEDQHPFLFVLLALVFFFLGGGKWSLDRLLFEEEK